MIKLINLLELEVNKPTITAEEVEKYWDYILDKGTGEEFHNKYDKFLIKWRKKFNKKDILIIFKKLNQFELREFYKDLKQLLNK